MPFVKYTPKTKLIYVRRILAGDRLDDINENMFQSPRQDTVNNWVQLFETTRSVISNPDWYAARGPPRVLSPEERLFLLEMIDLDPTLYLHEIATRLQEARGIAISTATLHVELHDRLALSLKVALTVDPCQDQDERTQFLNEMQNVPVESIIAFDESHVDRAELHRPRARCPIGFRTRRLPKATASHWHTLLIGMSLYGAIATKALTGSITRPTIEEFLEHDLLPMTSPYPGPNSMLLLDNASIHLRGNIQNLCDDFGVRLQYLPRYSPDFNPIEKGFNIIKARLRRERTLDWHHELNANQVAEILYLTSGEVLTAKMARSLFQGSIYL